MNENLRHELMRFGIEGNGGSLKTAIIIGEKEYEIPEPLQEFLGLLDERPYRKGPHVFYDRYHEGQREKHNSLSLILEGIALHEFDCINEAPYVVFALNGFFSNYIIRLDDEQPENPVVYYLDAEEYEEMPRTLKAGDGSELRLIRLFQESEPVWQAE